jgi:hypothetical protein
MGFVTAGAPSPIACAGDTADDMASPPASGARACAPQLPPRGLSCWHRVASCACAGPVSTAAGCDGTASDHTATAIINTPATRIVFSRMFIALQPRG